MISYSQLVHFAFQFVYCFCDLLVTRNNPDGLVAERVFNESLFRPVSGGGSQFFYLSGQSNQPSRGADFGDFPLMHCLFARQPLMAAG